MQTLFTSKPAKRILFACVPGDGHFNPLTGLAKHLQSVGYEVGWYAASKYEAKLNRLNIPFFRFSPSIDYTSEELETVMPERKRIRGAVKKLNFDLEHLFIRRGPVYYADMLEIYTRFPFDLLISDVAFTGSVFVKDLMRIPIISIGVLPLIESSRDLAPNGLGMEPSTGFFGRIKQSLLRLLVKKVLFRGPDMLMRRILDRYEIRHDNIFLFDLLSQKADYILQSGTPGFEYKRSDLSKNIRFIGSLLPHVERGNGSSWFDERLNAYERVVLVTQGTVEQDVNKILVPTLEAFKNTRTLVVCTTGGSRTQELRQRYPQQNLIIEDFIPFNDVMPHADVYITNGGYGGVMLGIENKLPLVVAGVHEGKNEICARIGHFKYGVNLKTETPSPAQISRAVEEVISNDLYKKNIEKLSREFATYHPQELCEQYVSELLHPKSKKSKLSHQYIN